MNPTVVKIGYSINSIQTGKYEAESIDVMVLIKYSSWQTSNFFQWYHMLRNVALVCTWANKQQETNRIMLLFNDINNIANNVVFY